MLALTRRIGESIHFTCKGYPPVTLTVISTRVLPAREATVRVEDTTHTLALSSRQNSKEVWLNLFGTQMVSLRLIDVEERGEKPARIGIVAPLCVGIIRDNAKLKESRDAVPLP